MSFIFGCGKPPPAGQRAGLSAVTPPASRRLCRPAGPGPARSARIRHFSMTPRWARIAVETRPPAAIRHSPVTGIPDVKPAKAHSARAFTVPHRETPALAAPGLQTFSPVAGTIRPRRPPAPPCARHRCRAASPCPRWSRHSPPPAPRLRGPAGRTSCRAARSP